MNWAREAERLEREERIEAAIDEIGRAVVDVEMFGSSVLMMRRTERGMCEVERLHPCSVEISLEAQ